MDLGRESSTELDVGATGGQRSRKKWSKRCLDGIMMAYLFFWGIVDKVVYKLACWCSSSSIAW